MLPEDLIDRAQDGDGENRADPFAPSNNPALRFELEGFAHDDPEPPWPRRLWLHILLFILTFFTTTLVGAHMMFNFRHDLPPFE